MERDNPSLNNAPYTSINDIPPASPAAAEKQRVSGSMKKSVLDFLKSNGVLILGIVVVISVVLGISIFATKKDPKDVIRTDVIPRPVPNMNADYVVLAFNDIYEIVPVGGMGGLAHVQSVKNKVIEQYGQEKTFTVLAGDLYSPSALNQAVLVKDGESSSFNGRHMVDCLNTLGLDLATLGNHEFDLKEVDFMQRLNESIFPYVAANVHRSSAQTDVNVPDYTNIVPYYIDKRNGITALYVSIVIDVNKGKNNYAQIENISKSIEIVKAQLAKLKQDNIEYDVLIALTHVSLDHDVVILEAIPEIDLLIGGHEHTNMKFIKGKRNVPLTKADSNVKTMYLHTLRVDKTLKNEFQRATVKVDSELIYVEPTYFPAEPRMEAKVAEWWALAKESFKDNNGFDIDQVVTSIPVDFDLRDIVVRSVTHTPFGDLLLRAFKNAAIEEKLNTPLFAIFQGGSIRIDDKLLKGPIKVYDILRVLPYAGKIAACDISGKVLKQALVNGSMPGWGGFLMLHSEELQRMPNGGVQVNIDGVWTDVTDDAQYQFVTSDYLAIDGGDGIFPALTCKLSTQQQQNALETMLRNTYGTRMYKRATQPRRTYRLLNV